MFYAHAAAVSHAAAMYKVVAGHSDIDESCGFYRVLHQPQGMGERVSRRTVEGMDGRCQVLEADRGRGAKGLGRARIQGGNVTGVPRHMASARPVPPPPRESKRSSTQVQGVHSR